ncbi:MAG: DUF1844 domain-containing protein [Desulfobacteraceae bacterium]|nr:DUF1844 domain-containing protein [Desulfobacteraceae bacterium]MCB9494679.1 DUF1844 domain-containing protein [Desulfobacteraceae bacterium]
MSEKTGSMPGVDFNTFIMSLNASALYNLGMIADPATGQKMKNISMAKQTIDIIAMLKEKTKGNLNDEEKNLIENILHDLRLMYVKES